MLTEICAKIRNYFTYDEDKHFGVFAINGGIITPPIDISTDYIRIVGSHLNDGVHKVSDNDLVDEAKFEGAVWVMSPPKAFLDLVSEIEAWQTKNGGVDSSAMSPFSSESFGGYSYSKGYGGNAEGSGTFSGWDSAFASRLNVWRKI